MSNIRLVSFSDQSKQKQKVTTSSRRNYESQVMAYGSYNLARLTTGQQHNRTQQ